MCHPHWQFGALSYGSRSLKNLFYVVPVGAQDAFRVRRGFRPLVLAAMVRVVGTVVGTVAVIILFLFLFLIPLTYFVGTRSLVELQGPESG